MGRVCKNSLTFLKMRVAVDTESILGEITLCYHRITLLNPEFMKKKENAFCNAF